MFLPMQLSQRLFHQPELACVAAVRNRWRETPGDAEPTLRLGEQHDAAVDVIRPPSKAALTFWRHRLHVNASGTVIRQSLLLLDRRTASATGIMPHIRDPEDVRLVTRAREVIE
jgi:hypothetical protein